MATETIENNQTSSQYLDMDLLRFTTAGSVDDGKSTLIGRLLFDSKSIFEDQLLAIENTSKQKGIEHVDLSLLTDGLKAEREQGITIDVAYRYFATPKRKFIIADTPGHTQYTRNMVTGASTANVAIILVDARHGVIEQTCRHSFIASLLQIKTVIVCVNKMDLVDFAQEAFDKIVVDYTKFAENLTILDIRFIPISALKGDNVVDKSKNTPWYTGSCLLETLENVPVTKDKNYEEGRFPVQYVIRPHSDEFHDFRGYAGKVEGGVFKPGDKVVALPSGLSTKIKTIETMDGKLDEAFPPMSVVMTLENEIDISRGDMIVHADKQPKIDQEVDVMVCWLGNKALQVGGKYTIRHTTREVRCIIKEVDYKVNINTLGKTEGDNEVNTNDIAKIKIKTTQPLFFDAYNTNRNTGSLIIIDEGTNVTVGAGMIVE